MAEAVLLNHAEFCHGSTQVREEEKRVITEPAFAAFLWDDLTCACAGDHFNFTSRLCDGDRGMEGSQPWARLGS